MAQREHGQSQRHPAPRVRGCLQTAGHLSEAREPTAKPRGLGGGGGEEEPIGSAGRGIPYAAAERGGPGCGPVPRQEAAEPAAGVWGTRGCAGCRPVPLLPPHPAFKVCPLGKSSRVVRSSFMCKASSWVIKTRENNSVFINAFFSFFSVWLRGL